MKDVMEDFGEDKEKLKKLLTGRRVQLAEELSKCIAILLQIMAFYCF